VTVNFLAGKSSAPEHRIALVTGAGRGLGRAIVEGLSSDCSGIVLVSRTRAELEQTAESITRTGCRLQLSVADVRDPSQVASVVRSAIGTFGTIDYLVNAAGISPIYTRSESVEPEQWDLVIEVNLRGTFLFCRAVGQHMLTRGGGSIVNVSSIGATTGLARTLAYNASKAGVEALTRTMAVEWAQRGVRVNAVAPAFFKTDMTSGVLGHTHLSDVIRSRTPMNRFGDRKEIVGAVRFLLSDDASYVTGSTLFVDGGWHVA
jgi:NAD(P)-dependent dehydrogenase (short-subunit alcohol dehydrogenase family)